MRILLVSNLYPSSKAPFYGSFVKNFEDQLRNYPKVDSVKGIFLKGLHGSFIKKLLLYFIFYLKILYFSIFYKYDLIYVHLISHSTLPLRLVHFFKPSPIIFNIHGEDLLVTTPLASKLLKLALPLVKKSKYIVVPSHYFKAVTLKYIPDYPADKIIISASGGIKENFYPIKEKKGNSSSLKIGYVSRIDRGKGWDTLINALKILAKYNINTVIVGGGAQVDILKSTIVENNLSNVSYIGPIAHDDLPEFYRSLDVFIFPTLLRESLGLVGLEAMACGVPVIGSEIGGLTDYIKDGYNGFFFSPGNAEELASKILQYYKMTSAERKTLSDNAITTANKYSEHIVSYELFDTIL